MQRSTIGKGLAVRDVEKWSGKVLRMRHSGLGKPRCPRRAASPRFLFVPVVGKSRQKEEQVSV